MQSVLEKDSEANSWHKKSIQAQDVSIGSPKSMTCSREDMQSMQRELREEDLENFSMDGQKISREPEENKAVKAKAIYSSSEVLRDSEPLTQPKI